MYYGNKNKIGVVPIALVVTTAVKALPNLISFIRNISQRPAGEARDVINVVKQQITNQDARTRLATVVAGSKQNFKAEDVDIQELLLWYRQNYSNDYIDLLPEDKLYWNSYLENIKNTFGFLNTRPDLVNLINQAYFTKDQINYKPETPGTQKAGLNMWVTLGIVGAGILLLTKKKK